MTVEHSDAPDNWQTATFLCIPMGPLYQYYCPVNVYTIVKWFLLIVFPTGPNRPQAELSRKKHLFLTNYTLLLAHVVEVTCTPRVIYKLDRYDWFCYYPYHYYNCKQLQARAMSFLHPLVPLTWCLSHSWCPINMYWIEL